MQANPIDLLKAFLSHETNVQKEAERQLNQLAKESPNDSIELYISAIDYQESYIAELAAVSIKKYHFQNCKDFQLIHKEKLAVLEKKILSLISEGDRTVKLYKRLIEILVLFYANDNDTYSYLVQNLLSLENVQNNKIKISIMYFMEILCEHCFNEAHLKQASGDLVQLFEKYIVDTDITVAISAVKAIISFLSSIEDKDFVKKFSQILPVLLNTLITAVKQDEDSGVSLIQSLGDLIEAHPTFVKPIIEDMLATMTEIMKEKTFTDAIRNQAMNCIDMLGQFCDVAIRKSENFKKLVIPALMEILCEIKEISLKEWLEDLEGQTISKADPYFIAQDIIGKLSDSLKAKFLLPQFMAYITQCIQNDQWYFRHAGYIAISVLAEGSAATFKGELDQLMQLVLPGFEHSDPRVAYAVTNAVALLCDEYAPTLQKKYHKSILSNLVKLMNDDNCLRNQLQATRTIVNFCSKIVSEEDENKIVTPYADDLLGALAKLFQKAIALNSDLLLEDVLSAISMLSSVLDLEFGKYYNEFAPGLQNLLETIPSTDEKHTSIRLESISCFGFIITSIRNREDFVQEVDRVMEYFVTLQKRLDKGDLEQACILEFYVQVSSHMREQFVKYMPHIYESVLEASEINIKLATYKDEDIGELADKKFALKGKVDKNFLTIDNFVFDTSAFGIKVAACNTIFSLSRNLNKAFYPYISYTIPKIVPHFGFHVKEMATSTLKTVKNLLKACEKEEERAEIIANCLPSMIKAVETHMIKEDVHSAHYVLKRINKGFDFIETPSISDQLISDLFNVLSGALTFCDQEKKKVVSTVKSLEDCDEEKREEIEKKYEEVNDLMQIIMDISGKLLKIYGSKVEGLIGNGIAPYYYKFFKGIETSVSNNEVFYAVCLFVDILEFCSQGMFEKVAEEALSKFLEFCKKPLSLDVLHNSVFGLGTISKRLDRSAFKQVRGEILQTLSSVITASDASSDAKANITDNAISSLGKIALYQSDRGDKMSEEVLLKFLQLLPLKNDADEAQNVHKMLFEEILKKNESLVMGSPEVQKALIDAISNINKLASENPEAEILDEEGKNLLAQVMNSA